MNKFYLNFLISALLLSGQIINGSGDSCKESIWPSIIVATGILTIYNGLFVRPAMEALRRDAIETLIRDIETLRDRRSLRESVDALREEVAQAAQNRQNPQPLLNQRPIQPDEVIRAYFLQQELEQTRLNQALGHRRRSASLPLPSTSIQETCCPNKY